MSNNNQRKGLKAWVRYDGNNNAVASSLIFQKSKPKVGKWKEYMDVNLCCPTPDPTTLLSSTVSESEGVYCVEAVSISCNDSASIFYPVSDLFSVSLEELILGLNTQLGNLGVWEAVSETEVGVNISTSFLNTFCPGGTITISFSCGG